MWLPSDEEPKYVLNGSLVESKIPETGYIRILSRWDESILFIRERMIVGAWNLNTDSLKETYEGRAMKLVDVNSESTVEIYEMGKKLFETIMELNEEIKLASEVGIGFVLDRVQVPESSRDDLLSRYRIQQPSENDVESLINDYKMGGG